MIASITPDDCKPLHLQRDMSEKGAVSRKSAPKCRNPLRDINPASFDTVCILFIGLSNFQIDI